MKAWLPGDRHDACMGSARPRTCREMQQPAGHGLNFRTSGRVHLFDKYKRVSPQHLGCLPHRRSNLSRLGLKTAGFSLSLFDLHRDIRNFLLLLVFSRWTSTSYLNQASSLVSGLTVVRLKIRQVLNLVHDHGIQNHKRRGCTLFPIIGQSTLRPGCDSARLSTACLFGHGMHDEEPIPCQRPHRAAWLGDAQHFLTSNQPYG